MSGDTREGPAWLRLPWWDVLFVAVPGLGSIAAVIITSIDPGVTWGRGLAAAGLTLAVIPLWFFAARQHLRPSPTGIALFVLVTVIMIVAMTLLPSLGMLQSLLYPYLWTVLDNVRRSIIASAAVSLAIGVAGVAAWGADAVPVFALTQSLGLLLSIGIGLAITYAWRTADERQAVVEELQAAHARVRELSIEAGVARERERLSRDLHDTLAQSLAGLSLLAERAARNARRTPDLEAARAPTLAQLDDIAELSRTALAETRALIVESAPVHDDAGMAFGDAVERLAERFRRETDVGVDVHVSPALARPSSALAGSASEAEPGGDRPACGGPLSRDAQVVLLRCLQEALANVRRHAAARTATVHLTTEHDGAVLSVSDDGRGFDRDELDGTGFGLPGLRERARLLGGSVELAGAPGQGTTVTVRLPLRQPAPAGAAAPSPHLTPSDPVRSLIPETP